MFPDTYLTQCYNTAFDRLLCTHLSPAVCDSLRTPLPLSLVRESTPLRSSSGSCVCVLYYSSERLNGGSVVTIVKQFVILQKDAGQVKNEYSVLTKQHDT